MLQDIVNLTNAGGGKVPSWLALTKVPGMTLKSLLKYK